jgi:hypothetical protein
VCHGRDDPKVHPFFCDLRKELNRLNPKTILPENETRGCTVRIRAYIGDAPARSWMCGTKGHSGFMCCPRCEIEGVHPIKKIKNPKWKDPNKPAPKPKKGAAASAAAAVAANANGTEKVEEEFIYKKCHTVKFPTIRKDPERKFEKWESYLYPPAKHEGSKIMVHRTGPTPLDKILEANPINDVPIESMHSMDIGVCKDSSAFAINIKITDKNTNDDPVQAAPLKRRGKNAPVDGGSKKRVPKITPKAFQPWNVRINAWNSCTPKEFGRRLDSLEYFNKWKATGHRLFFMYYLPALMYADPKRFCEHTRHALLHINLGYRLLSGNAHKEVPESDITRAEKQLKFGFDIFTKLSGGSWCTYKCHLCMAHIGMDVRYFKAPLGSYSAYPYENQMIFFRQIGLQGNHPIKQIANQLAENGGQLDDDEFPDPKNTCPYHNETFESFFAKVMRNKASRPNMCVSDCIDFPPFFVHSFNQSRKIIHCESFTITQKFPDNVVRLHFESHRIRERNAFCIEEIITDEKGCLFLIVREFANIKNSFAQPYASASIMNFLAWGGLKDSQTVPFSRVIGKYFAFPLLLQIQDDKGKFNPRCLGQNWILHELEHSGG